MNWICAIPIEARILAMFLLGAVLGSLANLATYRLAWHRRAISPWSAAERDAPERCWFDRVPIFGWLGLWREAGLHGRGFWIRPMAIELLSAFALAWLYYWEVAQAGLYGSAIPRAALLANWQGTLHIQFMVHTVFVWFMLVASLIDLDEKTIPDEITVPGTLVGLLAAALLPLAALPEGLPFGVQPVVAEQWPRMTLTSPGAAPGFPGGFPLAWPLAVALGCWLLWCFALLRRDWYTRHGLGRALRLCLARLARDRSTVWIGFMAACGAGLIVFAWSLGGRGWTSLVSALVGMAVAAGMVWAVRLIAGAVMQREAMGFGDVTLMAMIGTYVGWQASILVFFLAPLVGVVVGLAKLLLRRDEEIPYGPFLCLATLFVLIRWHTVWDWAGPRFQPGWLVPGMLLVCLVLLAVLLALWQITKRLLFRRR